jgi:hypothetical protein
VPVEQENESMASRPISQLTDHGTRVAAPARLTVSIAAATQLSDFEWSIVAMAERDSLASLGRPNRFWALMNLLFGLKPANRLASDRLEALRRVAVLAWHYRWNVPESELQAFFEAGYSPAQYEHLQSRIASVRAAQSRRKAR